MIEDIPNWITIPLMVMGVIGGSIATNLIYGSAPRHHRSRKRKK